MVVAVLFTHSRADKFSSSQSLSELASSFELCNLTVHHPFGLILILLPARVIVCTILQSQSGSRGLAAEAFVLQGEPTQWIQFFGGFFKFQ